MMDLTTGANAPLLKTNLDVTTVLPPGTEIDVTALVIYPNGMMT